MLRTSLRGDVELVLLMGEDLWLVEVDPGELEAALLNIAVNARDALVRGGRFEIAVRNEVASSFNVTATPQSYPDHVAISLRDNGTGIAREVLPRVFEPFFTTKDVGSGTGLGLSQVYGFARQSGGHATIESELGVGTCVTLHLPRAQNPLTRAEEPPKLATKRSPTAARVLLVEDNVEVARAIVTMLRAMGFLVESLHRARTALDRIESGVERVDLLLTDIVMPDGMNGLDLAQEVRARFPELPILLMSGYNEAIQWPNEARLRILRKPVPFAELEAAVHDQLCKL
jgi:CheY-like chemotaxis protein